MENNHKKQMGAWWADIIIGLLVAALLIALVWFLFDVINLYQTGVIMPAVSRIHRRPVVRPTLAVGQIEGWMTFRYINYVFRLPTGYLMTKLNITDSGYLNMNLDKYASLHKLKSADFAQSVREAVTAYSN